MGKGSSSSSSTSNTQTTYNSEDNRKAASDGGIIAENSTLNVTTLDPNLAAVGYEVIGGVAGDALVSNANVAKNAVDANAVISINANNAMSTLASGVTREAIDGQTAAQERALNTVDLAINQASTLLQTTNEQDEITRRELIREIGDIHEDNTAYAYNLQVEQNKILSALAENYANKLHDNNLKDPASAIESRKVILGYVAVAAALLVAAVFIFKKTKTRRKSK